MRAALDSALQQNRNYIPFTSDSALLEVVEYYDRYGTPTDRLRAPYALGCVVVFWFFRMYRGMWSLAGLKELLQVLEASLITSLLHAVLITCLIEADTFDMPLWIWFMPCVTTFPIWPQLWEVAVCTCVHAVFTAVVT